MLALIGLGYSPETIARGKMLRVPKAEMTSRGMRKRWRPVGASVVRRRLAWLKGGVKIEPETKRIMDKLTPEDLKRMVAHGRTLPPLDGPPRSALSPGRGPAQDQSGEEPHGP